MKKRNQINSAIQNQATLSDEIAQGNNGQCCDNFLLFAMRDNHHEFTLGIKTILECLSLAEKEGEIPALPSDWWLAVINHYRIRVNH